MPSSFRLYTTISLLLGVALLASCSAATNFVSSQTTSSPELALSPTVLPTLYPTPMPQSTQRPQANKSSDVRALGNPAAPITLTIFTDYQCPYCRSFIEETKPLLEEQYINAGKVYFVVRDNPLSEIHPGAEQAAFAANCAADQSAFWAMHDRLYEGRANYEWGDGGTSDRSIFLSYAEELKLDAGAFERCLDDQKQMEKRLRKDVAQAEEQGFYSTPSFLIKSANDEEVIIGAEPFSVFRNVIEDILTKQSQQSK